MISDLVAEVHDLKFRLEWGQPAFTIIDVRDRHTYNYNRITGAMQMPLDELVKRAKSALHQERQIYIYGDSDTQAGYAVQLLRAAGFMNATVLRGGIKAWKIVGGATEGVAA
ncbi:rhodanese-like domain-containing protein [Nodularia spumigena CS-584]|jgi:rhodanese-related sulfurtransferase|uniref:Rhodanese n=2 Tax=Nodularia spumigena TaxID=70799 RepID=A0A166HZI9_NODSP|nr:rhodanese-like domain-containing protein [Nodularia spumigena]AHJ30749.1 Rhodanese-like sulfurtransferase [Nodularia spumigena CCY9414]EAW44196.1 Rhodanese-like protein [Nodularia spumigena CCY9414]KZL47661.1 rhodanese [Nodularia spumigena CENA596]MDB9384162.1 rhodanese-like domain-containing protein [Nodularia spumigena CS-584]MEA5525242.1 rhodanese-like domain-containing protein [Nodularia spumigena UHCC 0143]